MNLPKPSFLEFKPWASKFIEALEKVLDGFEKRIQDLEFKGWRTISKSSDTARNTTTSLADDPDLLFPVEAYGFYRFKFVVYYDTSTAADFKFDVNGPASPTLVQIETRTISPGATAYGNIALKTAFAFSAVALTETSGTNGKLTIEGILQNGANAGNVSLRWAQNTSNGSDTKVRAGSHVQWAKA